MGVEPPPAGRRPDLVPVAFALTLGAAAFLLFLVQPIVGKLLLPRFGGVPAVWTTCQLFFQAVLLLGYGYAHLSATRLGPRAGAALHAGLLAAGAAVLPIGVPAWAEPPADGSPAPVLLLALGAAVGLPFLAVSATAPLLQAWYAGTARRSAADPYILYAASNLGSLAALVGYPAAVERWVPLGGQAAGWAAGYLLVAGLILGCRWLAGPVARPAAPAGAGGVRWADRGRWVLLAFVPSALLLAATAHITTDIAPLPLLWVLPLGLYLLSFIIAFGRPPGWVGPAAGGAVLVVLAVLMTGSRGRWADLALHLGLVFAAALALHAELARRRPPAAGLTEFYLWVSAGGVLGGAANAVLAPLLLDGPYEYRLLLVLTVAVLPVPAGLAARWRRAWAAPVLLAAALAGLLAVSWAEAGQGHVLLHRSRNFFGSLMVIRDRDQKVHRLYHGTTTHGVQLLHEKRNVRRLPLTYYDPTGPIGQVFLNDRSKRYPPVAVVGLGAGSLASYIEAGQEIAFFEIDPDVVRVARDPDLFTYLGECKGELRVVTGDARLTLAREPDGHFGRIVLDAFTSDAVPVHLLTVEAIELYLSKLAPDGLLAVHVSNKYLDLDRVLDGAAGRLRLLGRFQADKTLSPADVKRGKLASEWVLLARTPAAFHPVDNIPYWKPLPGDPAAPVWTDDFANLLDVLRLSR